MARPRTNPVEQKTWRPNGKLSIRQARRKLGYQQKDLARLTGYPQPLISWIEQGTVLVPRKDRPKWEWALQAEGRITWPD